MTLITKNVRHAISVAIGLVFLCVSVFAVTHATGDTSSHSSQQRTTTSIFKTQTQPEVLETYKDKISYLDKKLTKNQKAKNKVAKELTVYKFLLYNEFSKRSTLENQVQDLESKINNYQQQLYQSTTTTTTTSSVNEDSIPPATSAPPSNGYSNTDCQYADLIHSYFQSAGSWAVSIAWRESRCIPSARNPSGASGLFQMMLPLHNNIFTSVGCSPSSWADPVCNVKAAKKLYDMAGTSPWHL